MPNFVQMYKSTDLGAPVLSGQVNSLIRLLDAVLVNGYNSPNQINSLTGNGATSTATVPSTASLVSGLTVTVAGASIGGFNVTATITVTSATTFTYPSAGNGTPTGTITFSPVLPITTITFVGPVATVTTTQPNQNLVTGNYFTIQGATGGDAAFYNGTFQVTLVSQSATSTVFTYTMSGTPAGDATGTLAYYKAGLQWTKPFAAGTNSQSYRSADVTSNQFYLQVIDNGATAGGTREAQCYGAEVLTANNTPNNGGGAGSGQFPTTAQHASNLCWPKTNGTTNTTVNSWTIWGDDRTFYYGLGTALTASTGGKTGGFGHFFSYKSGDGYNTFIAGSSAFNTAASLGGLEVCGTFGVTSATTSSLFVARPYTQTGTSLSSNVNSTGGVAGGIGGAGPAVMPWPNLADMGLWFVPVMLWEVANPSLIRGRLPGLYAPMQNGNANLTAGDQIVNITGLSGVTLTAQPTSSSSGTNLGCLMFDTFGPWA